MQSLLTEQHSHGEYLLQAARLVGDPDDYAIWRAGRASWLDAVAGVIAGAFSVEQAAQFRELCQTPTESDAWKRQYEAELRTLQAGLELLLTLRKALAAQAPGAPALELEDGQ